VLITGGAGFIGSHVVDRFLRDGWRVTALDNFDDFYDPALKRLNVAPHLEYESYSLVEADIRDTEALHSRLRGEYDVVIHLAARAGVRPSIACPLLYQDVNVSGTHNLLELCRQRQIKQFVFASSSSVYGVNPNVPWREDDGVLLPISPYASTKISGELLGHVYSHLFGIRFIALRFFTVYGPRQRPDLAIRSFAERMLRGESIALYGDGRSRRDYTFIDDIVQLVSAAASYDATSFEVINAGNNRTVSLSQLVLALEELLGTRARIERLPNQPGDVPQTWASTEKAGRLLGYAPATTLTQGLERFASWLTSSAEGAASRAGTRPARSPSLPSSPPVLAQQ
jgi:UDP-glucuronate 4-epimerase